MSIFTVGGIVGGIIGGIVGQVIVKRDRERKIKMQICAMEHQLHMQQAKYLGYYCCVPTLVPTQKDEP